MFNLRHKNEAGRIIWIILIIFAVLGLFASLKSSGETLSGKINKAKVSLKPGLQLQKRLPLWP